MGQFILIGLLLTLGAGFVAVQAYNSGNITLAIIAGAACLAFGLGFISFLSKT